MKKLERKLKTSRETSQKLIQGKKISHKILLKEKANFSSVSIMIHWNCTY